MYIDDISSRLDMPYSYMHLKVNTGLDYYHQLYNLIGSQNKAININRVSMIYSTTKCIQFVLSNLQRLMYIDDTSSRLDMPYSYMPLKVNTGLDY